MFIKFKCWMPIQPNGDGLFCIYDKYMAEIHLPRMVTGGNESVESGDESVDARDKALPPSYNGS